MELEIKIGRVFNYDYDKTLRCLESDYCTDCYFKNDKYCIYKFKCKSYEREDNKNVIFQKVNDKEIFY